MARNIYNFVSSKVGKRSLFDLTHSYTTSADMGLLIPVMCEEANPGDTFKLAVHAIIRAQPLVAPIAHEINVFFHDFFVPYRLLMEGWERFITRDVDGNFVGTLPLWEVTGQRPTPQQIEFWKQFSSQDIAQIADNGIGSLWDYFGFPTGVIPRGAFPIDFPRRAYVSIWNNFYRDQNMFQNELAIDGGVNWLLPRAWEKDYFTSALPWQQRGTAPALPVTGTASAIWKSEMFKNQSSGNAVNLHVSRTLPDVPGAPQGTKPFVAWAGQSGDPDLMVKAFNNNVVDFANATTVNISDLRLAFQIQKWMEKNARCGSRYVEYLRAHYGVSPTDDRLDRPEYIGGYKLPIVISEVLQTSATQQDVSPQGNMSGHGISASGGFTGTYRVKEHGLIIRLMSIMPRTMYSQGINRMWLRRTTFDFPAPEFTALSEQAIMRAELIASNDETKNKQIFGFQGIFNELRSRSNCVTGQLRPQGNLAHWSMSRNLPEDTELNWPFMLCNPRVDCFAVQNEPKFICSVANIVKSVRQLPIEAVPGGFM